MHQCVENLGHKVRGRHQVDVVRSFALQLEHHACQALYLNDFAVAQLAYGVVLAEAAASGAAGEEDGPGSTRPTQGRFLPAVGVPTGDLGEVAHAADTPLVGHAICATAMGTELAGLEHGAGRLSTTAELSGLV